MTREYRRSAPQTAQRAQDQARRNGNASPPMTAPRTFAANPLMHDVRDLASTGLDEPTPMELRARNGQQIEMRRVGDVTEETGPSVMPDASAGHTPEQWESSQVTDADLARENQITMARMEILEIGARPRRIARNLAAWRQKQAIENATGALPNSTEEKAADKSALLSLFMDSLKAAAYERDAERVAHFESVAAEAESALAERHGYHPRVKLAAIIADF
jgi:hypothetical protein